MKHQVIEDRRTDSRVGGHESVRRMARGALGGAPRRNRNVIAIADQVDAVPARQTMEGEEGPVVSLSESEQQRILRGSHRSSRVC
jgi:hypothetical protein